MSAETGGAPSGALRVVDSHTEGEPTRVVIEGWPALAGSTMRERRDDLTAHFDHLRRGVVCEPRGHDAIVGALLTPPVEPGSHCGVVYFDDVGTIGMCGHGTIGVVRTLEYLGRLQPGVVRIDTPVGTVSAELHADGAVTVMNIPASVAALDVTVEVPPVGTVTGAVAWTGNWFFLTDFTRDWNPRTGVRGLTQIATAIRHALRAQGITGRDGARIDHIELGLRPTRPDADARNFVLCPGAAYDRSPCGTGTAALMAVRHARGELALGERWRQESITGSLFTGWLEQRGDDLIPFIRGHAFITGEATLRFDALDPFRWGLPAGEG